ncbi:hypothetical protein FB451DRAFT_995435, partial [Mycena latifolia]
NHYSTYRDLTESTVLDHGDSMHSSANKTILEIFQWVLTGTGQNVPVGTGTLETSRQLAGSGSCGIAALNLIESDLDVRVDKWTNSTSHIFRRRALRDLTVYH